MFVCLGKEKIGAQGYNNIKAENRNIGHESIAQEGNEDTGFSGC